MRITNNMMVNATVRNLNSNLERLSKAQEQISSSSKISSPSDDPIIAGNDITYRSYLAQTEQYQNTIDSAQSWQDATDDALSQLSDIVTSLYEYVNQASSSTADMDTIQTYVETLQSEAIDVLNTSYAGRYIFAGYDTGEAPYALETTDIGTKVTYKGQYLSVGSAMSTATDSTSISDFISTNASSIYDESTAKDEAIVYNIDYGTTVQVNVEGQDVTGSGLGSLFDTFAKVLLGLDGETSYQTADVTLTTDSSGNTTATSTVTTTSFTMSSLLSDVSDCLNTITTAQTKLGSTMDFVDTTSDKVDDEYTNYETLRSNNIDVDVAEAYTEYSSAESVYEAALSVGASVIQKSLVDYLA